MPFLMIRNSSGFTPSSSQPIVEQPPACERSPWMFMNAGPYLNLPSFSRGGATKLVPA